MSLVDQQLFAVPRSKAAKNLNELYGRRRELQQRRRAELQCRDRARAEHERLVEQVKSAEALALAHDQPANTKRDRARVVKLADQAAEYDRSVTAVGAAIAAIEQEIRQRAQAARDELIDEAVADHEQALNQASAALASLAAAQARARGAYVAVQAIAANAGATYITAQMRDVPNVEQIVRDGGIASLLPDHDRRRRTGDNHHAV